MQYIPKLKINWLVGLVLNFSVIFLIAPILMLVSDNSAVNLNGLNFFPSDGFSFYIVLLSLVSISIASICILKNLKYSLSYFGVTILGLYLGVVVKYGFVYRSDEFVITLIATSCFWFEFKRILTS